ncbi:MAG: serine/threonine protein kinase [Planctomycetota bacterium]|jgi:serine/threonine protein kinase
MPDERPGDPPSGEEFLDPTIAPASQLSSTVDGLPVIPGLRLDRILGAGAMGEVYAGCQEYLNRDVAVKMLGPQCRGASYEVRFKREATIQAGLTHESIVACYDAGITPDGNCYFVMERVLGPSLSRYIRSHGKLSTKASLRLTLELAGALKYAHDTSQIIHRDVKPANVLLAPLEGSTHADFPYSAKLADLGLARPVAPGSQDMALTAEGAVVGTPSTMGPEQFDDPGGVDHRADIYALGCVLFHALTGQAAFRGQGLTAIIRAKTGEALGPDATQIEASVPKGVAAFASRLMAAERSDRPQTYTEVIDECTKLLQAAQQQASAPRPTWTKYAMIGVLIAGSALAIRAIDRSKADQQAQAETFTDKDLSKAAHVEPETKEVPAPTEDTAKKPVEQDTDPKLTEQPTPDPEPEQETEQKPTEQVLAKQPEVVLVAPTLAALAPLHRQAGTQVSVQAKASHPDNAELAYLWSWLSSTDEEPPLQNALTAQVSFLAPSAEAQVSLTLQVQVSSATDHPSAKSSTLITIYPEASALNAPLALSSEEDFYENPHWKPWQRGANYGNAMDDSGMRIASKQCSIIGTQLPGGDWVFAGALMAEEFDSPPAEFGLVISYPHGKRYCIQLVQTPAPDGTPGAEWQLRTQDKGADGWSDPLFVSTLGALELPEAGVPITVTRRGNEVLVKAGKLSKSFTEPVAPDGLGFCVTGGTGRAGVLLDPSLTPL